MPPRGLWVKQNPTWRSAKIMFPRKRKLGRYFCRKCRELRRIPTNRVLDCENVFPDRNQYSDGQLSQEARDWGLGNDSNYHHCGTSNYQNHKDALWGGPKIPTAIHRGPLIVDIGRNGSQSVSPKSSTVGDREDNTAHRHKADKKENGKTREPPLIKLRKRRMLDSKKYKEYAKCNAVAWPIPYLRRSV